MTLDEVRRAFEDEVHIALFRAEGPRAGPGKHVLVYAFKDGRRGYLWTEWNAVDLDNISGSIKDGGKARSFREAVNIAVERLCDHIDPLRC